MTNAEVTNEKIINHRYYHTIKELKNGEGPHPIKTPKGWLHLAHGVRNCAAGLRYVLYIYVTDLDQPDKLIAEPAGHFMAPLGEERVGMSPMYCLLMGGLPMKMALFIFITHHVIHVCT